MSINNRQLGWSYPEIEKYISVYGEGFKYIDIPQGVGDVYSKRGILSSGEEVVIIFDSKPTSEQGMVMDFIQQQWMIHNKHTTSEGKYTAKALSFNATRTNEVVISTATLCEVIGMKDTPSNTNRIYKAIQSSKNMNIISTDTRYIYEYSIISEFKYDTLLEEHTITLSPMYLDKFCKGKMRSTFIDTHRELSVKGSLAIEIKRLLVARGGGNDKMPKEPQALGELFLTLGLNRELNRDIKKFNRALKKFKEVEKVSTRYSKKLDAYIFTRQSSKKPTAKTFNQENKEVVDELQEPKVDIQEVVVSPVEVVQKGIEDIDGNEY